MKKEFYIKANGGVLHRTTCEGESCLNIGTATPLTWSRYESARRWLELAKEIDRSSVIIEAK
jgi:hypothetical protein